MPPRPGLRDELETALLGAVDELRRRGFPEPIARRLTRLGEQVREPFTLAVVGQVKAGKSSLVNALLGCDLPTVGATEVTATVNWFRYGSPEEAHRVYCYRRGASHPERLSLSSLSDLQGDSPRTLAFVAAVERLEFRLPVEWLRFVTLVDTPGLNAVAPEHQDLAASFLGVASQLRRKNADATLRLAREADAILYVLGPSPTETDRVLLEEFHRATGGEDVTVDAIAAIGKMDWFDPDPTAWQGYRESVARLFRNVVSEVVPVSVSVRDFSRRLNGDASLAADFSRLVHMDDGLPWTDLLASPACFRTESVPAISSERRSALIGKSPWTAVQAAVGIGRKTASAPGSDLLEELGRVAGIDALRSLIDESFVARGPMLRCRRIARDAEAELSDPAGGGVSYVEACAREDHFDRAEVKRYVALLDRIQPALLPQDRAIADSLRKRLGVLADQSARAPKAQAAVDSLAASITRIRRRLEESIADLGSLRMLDEVASLLTADEAKELRRLFDDGERVAGERWDIGDEALGFVKARERRWRTAQSTNDRLQSLYERAARRYANMLSALVASATTSASG